ncbi:MAG: STAS-like domain-containing protein [Stenomitos frigidus ULC029]
MDRVNKNKRGEEIRQFILNNVEKHPKDVVALAAKDFGVSRQAINKHMQKLVQQKALLAEGASRNRTYSLASEIEEKIYPLGNGLEEDVVWSNDIAPLLKHLPKNIYDIWYYGFTEMVNNAIDHSSGKQLTVILEKDVAKTSIWIHDNGEGIFRKITRELDLADEHHALLELAKGKLTTDPERHSGQGIFFTSRMFDEFDIYSGNLCFSHLHDSDFDCVLDNTDLESGTLVIMKLSDNCTRTPKQVFDEFSSGDDYEFNKTIVPVSLAQYGNEKLVSRSQAKRLLARIDRFKIVIFNFDKVEEIGQAFADEVFRVFVNQHPDIQIMPINTNDYVQKMINRARKQENVGTKEEV